MASHRRGRKLLAWGHKDEPGDIAAGEPGIATDFDLQEALPRRRVLLAEVELNREHALDDARVVRAERRADR